MRIYKDCMEMVAEQERDLMEMGIEVQGYSYQDKVTEGDPDFYTKEVRGAVFSIINGQEDKNKLLEHFEIPLNWAEADFAERVDPQMVHNPGGAWTMRRDVWEQFLDSGKFAYSYSERIQPQLKTLMDELVRHPSSRQIVLDIHNNDRDLRSLGASGRLPCSLSYGALIRNDKLEFFYTMRSCDFLCHFGADIWMALSLQKHVVDYYNSCVEHDPNRKPISCGNFTYFCFSLHCFYKDLKARGMF